MIAKLEEYSQNDNFIHILYIVFNLQRHLQPASTGKRQGSQEVSSSEVNTAGSDNLSNFPKMTSENTYNKTNFSESWLETLTNFWRYIKN